MPELEVFDTTPARALAVDDLPPGTAVVQRVRFSRELWLAYDAVAHDRASIHRDPAAARAAGFEAPIVPGLALATRFSRLVGMYLPGERALLETVQLKFHRPTYADVELLYRVAVERVFRPMRIVDLVLSASVDGVAHITGTCRCLVR